MILFLAYSATKSIVVLIFFFVIFGIPALGLAFAKINGRPIYKMLFKILQFIMSPKELVFHKEAYQLDANAHMKDIEIKKPEMVAAIEESPQDKLKKINALLLDNQRKEMELLKK